jgi:phospholipid/cholesterol/gamma-HCH transport system ATP-binding protein
MEKIRIKLQKISKSFKKNNIVTKEVLKDCDLEIFDGKIHVILGGSGSGKSVLLKIMLGLEKFDSGTFMVDEEEICEKNFNSALLSKSGVLFQNNALFDSKNVYENIIFPFYGEDNFDMKKNKSEMRELVFEKLKQVGLNDESVMNLDVNELSGGMQKRVAIARALIKDPEIIFLDEPTSGLDMENSELIFNLIKKLNHTLGVTFIIITHDIFFAPKIADYIFFLENKKLNKISLEDIKSRFFDCYT